MPTIAQVHGYCDGDGTTWGLIPDITICSEDAWFQMPLVPGFGLPGLETVFEPWVYMNYKRAAEYIYTAKPGSTGAVGVGGVARPPERPPDMGECC